MAVSQWSLICLLSKQKGGPEEPKLVCQAPTPHPMKYFLNILVILQSLFGEGRGVHGVRPQASSSGGTRGSQASCLLGGSGVGWMAGVGRTSPNWILVPSPGGTENVICSLCFMQGCT